jgi:hypothetical protein
VDHVAVGRTGMRGSRRRGSAPIKKAPPRIDMFGEAPRQPTSLVWIVDARRRAVRLTVLPPTVAAAGKFVAVYR